MTSSFALRAQGIHKSFGPIEVLHGVDLVVPSGEIHGLLGQNGCGKSTLIKIITGIHDADAGSLEVWGRRTPLPVGRALDHGIAVVHQDIGIADELSVFDNICTTVGFGTRAWLPIPERRERGLLRERMRELGIQLDLDSPAGNLTAAERTFVGVLRSLRALHGRRLDECVLILDEPTTSLPAPDALQITRLMRRMADAGSGIIFISHRLGEVLAVCDSATILRSGSLVFQGSLAGVSIDQLTEKILGHRMEAFYPAAVTPQAALPPAMSVRQLRGDVIDGVDFDLAPGEVLGITGLMGMGQEELPGLLSGALPRRGGYVRLVDDEDLATTVRGAIQQGVALVPANRGRDGAWLEANARENFSLPRLACFRKSLSVDVAAEHSDVHTWMDRLGTVPLAPEQPLQDFSGGNQQKVVVAKWLATEPSVLLLDEPTQGIDAGAKHDVLEILLNQAEAGAGLIIFSGDHDQLAHVCNRVLVLREGRIAHEVSRSELSAERLMQLCNSL